MSSELNLEYLVVANERLASSTLRYDKGDYVIRFFSFFLKLLIIECLSQRAENLVLITFFKVLKSDQTLPKLSQPQILM